MTTIVVERSQSLETAKTRQPQSWSVLVSNPIVSFSFQMTVIKQYLSMMEEEEKKKKKEVVLRKVWMKTDVCDHEE
jgi:hypothetical protein